MPVYSSYDQALTAMTANTHLEGLSPRQQTLYTAYETIVEQYGQFNQGIDANGAHYGEVNPFASEGLVCANCVYYANNACELVQGNIAPGGICKLWIIPESKLN